jgi:hypothetical protein
VIVVEVCQLADRSLRHARNLNTFAAIISLLSFIALKNIIASRVKKRVVRWTAFVFVAIVLAISL